MGKLKNSKIYKKNSFYHIYNRGNRKNTIYNKEKDYQIFISLLYRYLKKNHLRLIAYCLMPNHYHMVIKCKSRWKEIPKFMHSFMTAYAVYYNRKYMKVGRLFQGPFQVKLLITKKDLLNEINYIKSNPQEIKNVELPYQWLYVIKEMNRR